MTTPLDIITLALKDIGVLGVGQTALAEDSNDAYTKLNWMLSQWQRKRYLVYQLIDLKLTSTGAQSYTVGPGGDFNTALRPNKIRSAFMRQLINPNPIDYWLTVLQSYEDYARITLKSLSSFAGYVFLDPGYPLGTLYFWPVPLANIYENHVQVSQILAQFTSITESVTLPEEYIPALHMNLAMRLAPGYGQPIDPTYAAMARESLEVLRADNSAIKKLMMPADLTRAGRYDPYSDQVR